MDARDLARLTKLYELARHDSTPENERKLAALRFVDALKAHFPTANELEPLLQRANGSESAGPRPSEVDPFESAMRDFWNRAWGPGWSAAEERRRRERAEEEYRRSAEQTRARRERKQARPNFEEAAKRAREHAREQARDEGRRRAFERNCEAFDLGCPDGQLLAKKARGIFARGDRDRAEELLRRHAHLRFVK